MPSFLQICFSAFEKEPEKFFLSGIWKDGRIFEKYPHFSLISNRREHYGAIYTKSGEEEAVHDAA